MAPEIRAGVMMANISWKAANTMTGMPVPLPANSTLVMDAAVKCDQEKSPNSPLLVVLPNANLNPKITHSTETMVMVTNDIIIMLRVLLARVRPP